MTNNDLISRSALMKYINEDHSYAGLPMAAHILTMELLTYAPAVDAVEVVHGRWEQADDGDGAVCSVCREDFCNIYLEVDRFKYCPNCGAKMDGKI